jgi:hypothetical protein
VLFILTANEHILTESWLQIVEVAITSVGMSVQDLALTMFIILPSSNECKSFFNTRAFYCSERIYLVNKSFYCVTGFDIIQALSSETILYSCDLSTSRSHAIICRLDSSSVQLLLIERGCLSKTEIGEREICKHSSVCRTRTVARASPSPPTRDKTKAGLVYPASPPPSTHALPMAKTSDFQGLRLKRRTASI